MTINEIMYNLMREMVDDLEAEAFFCPENAQALEFADYLASQIGE